MKTVKCFRSLMWLPFLVLLIVSCDLSEEDGSENQDLFLQERTQGVSWSLSLPSGPYAYTDRIPLLFSLELPEDSSDVLRAAWQELSLEPSNTVWGDFRVRRMGRSGAFYRVELIPRQSGECRISIPLYKGGADGGSASSGDQQPLLLLEPDLLLQVESHLNEEPSDAEPAGLLSETKKTSYGLWILFSFAVIAAAGFTFFLVIRKRRHASELKAEDRALQSLDSFLKERDSLEGSEDAAGVYRIIFRLLLNELDGFHPGLKGRGYGPAGLMAVLEQPSALNQIFLRSLYPLLGRMEEIFFTPDSVLPDDREYQEHRNLLKGWLAFMKEEKGEV